MGIINKVWLFAVFLFLFIPISFAAVDYRNAYMIAWDGTPCDNIKYAQNMGYDYVMYQTGMEKCPGPINLYFYVESPEQLTPQWHLYYNRTYSQANIDLYNDWFVQKSNSTVFPENIATGWFFRDGSFRPVANLQKQRIADTIIANNLRAIADKLQNKQKGFLFGGYAWDVPGIDTDFFTDKQNLPLINQSGSGKIVRISYWTGTCSSYGSGFDYDCLNNSKLFFYKKLLEETRKVYPDTKTYVQPYGMWTGYWKNAKDYEWTIPDMMCEESYKIDFMSDPRIINSFPKDRLCSDTSDRFNHSDNLKIMATMAVNGAWFGWFGRLGGTGDFWPLSSMRDVPDRLKLVRVIPGWDNLNGVPLSERKWNGSTYQSSLSFADNNLIFSVHPKNNMTYVVVINYPDTIYVNGDPEFYSLDSLMGIKSRLNIGNLSQITLDPGSYAISVKKDREKDRQKVSKREYIMQFNELRVKFKKDINSSKIKEKDILVSDGMIYVSPESELNAPAEITMFNIGPSFYILRNGAACGSYCSVKSYMPYSGTLVFDVPGFSNYSIGYYNNTYVKTDLKPIIEDGIGTFLAAIVSYIELIIIAFVLMAGFYYIRR